MCGRTETAQLYYKLIVILRRQYHIILTASWEKIYFVLALALSQSDGAQYGIYFLPTLSI